MRVLGVDPGLTRCGLGVVDGVAGRPLQLVAVDVVRTAGDDDIGAAAAGHRARGRRAGSTEHRPDAVAVERVFSQHNVRTVMGTAQASAVAIVAAARRGLPVALHTPSEVKAAVTGSGRADKDQVASDGHPDPAADRAAPPGGRRRRAGARDLPRLARGRAEQAGRRRRPGGAGAGNVGATGSATLRGQS